MASSMDELLKKHQQEEKFTLSKIAQLSKPKLGQKPLPKEQIAEQTAKLLGDLKRKQEQEIAELTEKLANAALDTPAPATEPSESTESPASENPAPASHVRAQSLDTTAGAVKEHAIATASASQSASNSAAADAGKKKSRAQRRKENKAAARANGGDSDDDSKPSGPDLREIEMNSILSQLTPKGLDIKPVTADGNCLFRAVSDQLLILSTPSAGGSASSHSAKHGASSGSSVVPDHFTLRKRAAEYIRVHWESFAPFLPYEPSDGFPEGLEPEPSAVKAAVEKYCARMGNSSAWGGHPELRALSCTLGLPVVVYQAGAPPFTITPETESMGDGTGSARAGRRRGSQDEDDSSSSVFGSSLMSDPNLRLQLSFHKTYYRLGEHYNSVVAKGTAPAGAGSG